MDDSRTARNEMPIEWSVNLCVSDRRCEFILPTNEWMSEQMGTVALTCFKSNVIVTYSYSSPDANVGLCHQFDDPSITCPMGCRRSVLLPSQIPHLVLRWRRNGCASMVWQYSSRVVWPHVAFAYRSAFGAILNICGHKPPIVSSLCVSGVYSMSATKAANAKETKAQN